MTKYDDYNELNKSFYYTTELGEDGFMHLKKNFDYFHSVVGKAIGRIK